MEKERTAELASELKRVRLVENKLKLKLLEVENRERQIGAVEADLRRLREDVASRLKRQLEEHAAQTKLREEQHQGVLRLAKEKLAAEERSRKSLENELARRRGRGDLEVKLARVEGELERALEREVLLTKSRDHFREAVLRNAGARDLEKTLTPPHSCKVSQITQLRTELLASKMYHEHDPLIGQIDAKISALSSSN